MKVIVALCLLAFPVLSSCVTKKSDATELKTLVSSDGVFRFRYSQILFQCLPANERTDELEPPGSCVSQMSICDDDDDSLSTFVCLGYPSMENTFAVAEVKEAKTVGACLKGPEGWPMSVHGTRIIRGVRFRLFEVSTAWTGGGLTGELYRTFHLNKCYELGIRSVWSHYNEDETSETAKKYALDVHSRLEEPLQSFRFLK